ncbi:hypothetical protein V6615_12845 [Oscillospiraceae bacterium PP1C4]
MSHILNAEGEKLQAIIAKAGVTPTELLAANKSVSSLVNSVTLLESVLQTKLSVFGCGLCS